MSGDDRDLPVVYLKAGELHYTDRPALVVTVLGSCLSVTMYDRRQGIGGMCHGLLPECGRKTCGSGCSERFRYVDCAILRLIRLFEKAGSRPGDVEVKCFGGADLFAPGSARRGPVSVGRRNIMIAQTVLAGRGFTIARQDVGGSRGRKLFFLTHTGEVLLKRLAGAVDTNPMVRPEARGFRHEKENQGADRR